MILNAPQMLLAAALPLIPITLAFPVDFSPIFHAIDGPYKARSASNLKTGDVNCKKDFPQIYKVQNEMKDIFEEAAVFRAHSQEVCDGIIPQLYKPKIKEYTLNFDVHDADIYVHSEQVLWDKDLRVVYKVTLTDKGYSEVHGKSGVSQSTLNKFCVGALEEYGTKGKGCTKDPQDFINTVVARTTTTGILAGTMKWMDGNEHFATLEVSFMKPE